ncbi:hypothetical protein a51_37 [Escherichia phage a51]|nr:hypothetical protein a51_37 [Escherichia phage a51]
MLLISNSDIFNAYNFNISPMTIARKTKFNWPVRVLF